MKATRRRFSREFKLEAVRKLPTGTRLVDVARALGVEPRSCAGGRTKCRWTRRRPFPAMVACRARRRSCSGYGAR